MGLPLNNRIALGLEGSTGDLHKFGYQGAIGTTSIAIWDVAAAYAYIAAATKLKLSSSHADDDAVTGQGAWTVRVTGLDANYDPLEEDVILDGQAAVETVGLFLRVFRMKVLTTGTLLDNTGIIYAGTGTVTSGVPANKYAAISAAENQTLMCLYTVPAGKTLLMDQLNVTGNATQVVTIRTVAREFGQVFQTKDKFLITQGQIVHRHTVPHAYPEKTDIEIRAVVSASTTKVSASFDGILYG